MAKFIIKKIKEGNDKRGFTYVLSIANVIADEGEEIIYLPSTFEGEEITHLGYMQGHEEGGERFHDWHHPAQGSEYVEEKYYATVAHFDLPKSVKKLVVSHTIKEVCAYSYTFCKHVELVIPEDHPYLQAKTINKYTCLKKK